ncbi:MAG: Smr/MutS family protein [Xanthomonadales bacterium]|nr:Smr/MutS family protein [Xanthomonadales bacterium]
MSKNNKTDTENFRTAMANVRPLKRDPRHREDSMRRNKPTGQPGTRLSKVAEFGFEDRMANDAAACRQVFDASSQSLPLLRNGLPRKLLRRMGSRHCPLADSFDLHGMNERTATKALNEFLTNAIGDGLACIRIVHGKGLRSDGPPVLKLMSWKLLWQHPAVLALKPCAPNDGGSGAVLVLLRAGQETASC